MRIPFSLYDFLGYAVPGFIVTVILVILINPVLLVDLPDQLKDKNSDLAQILRPTVTQGILYILLCYLIGLASHALTHWLFGVFSRIWVPLKRYYADSGIFEQALFDPKSRIYPEDFEQYTAQFLCKLKHKFKDVFKIDLCEIGETKGDSPVAYTEIFNLCRTVVLRHSEASAARTSALLALYNSARLLGSILFLASVGFLVRIFVSLADFQWVLIAIYLFILWLPWIWIETNEPEKSCSREKSGKFVGPAYWLIAGGFALVAGLWIETKIPQTEMEVLVFSGLPVLFRCYCISAVLCPIFFHLYHVLFRYYRNTILYGFYEYAVTREKSVESKDREN